MPNPGQIKKMIKTQENSDSPQARTHPPSLSCASSCTLRTVIIWGGGVELGGDWVWIGCGLGVDWVWIGSGLGIEVGDACVQLLITFVEDTFFTRCFTH